MDLTRQAVYYWNLNDQINALVEARERRTPPANTPGLPDTHGGSLVARPDHLAIGGGTGQGGRAVGVLQSI